MKTIQLALLPMLAITSLLFSPTRAQGQDVFDTLQENVWYLPTLDKAAQLYVTSLGRGTPVIVLHGGPGNDFSYLIDALRPAMGEHKFILYDQRGSLLSPVNPNAEDTLTAKNMVEDLDLLRRSLGIDKVVILGHSWGTLLAQLYYQAHPEHVAGLILVASFPPRTPLGFSGLVKEIRPRQKALKDRPEVAAAEKKAGVDGPQDSLSPRKYWTRFRIELAASNIYHVDRWPEFQGEGVYYKAAIDSAIGDSLPETFDISSTIAAHPVPITVIDGTEDYLDPSGKGWGDLMRNDKVKVLTIPNASHYSWIDDPELFQRDLKAALSR